MVLYFYILKKVVIIIGGMETPVPCDVLGMEKELIDWLQLQEMNVNAIEKINF